MWEIFRMYFALPKAAARVALTRCRTVILAGFAALFVVGGPVAASAAEINIYSHRQQFLLQPFLDAFTAETGIRTRVVYAAKGLRNGFLPKARPARLMSF